MKIELRSEQETFAERQARELGYANVSDYIHELLRVEERRQARRPSGREVVNHMRGKATRGLSTDEVMRLTRGEG